MRAFLVVELMSVGATISKSRKRIRINLASFDHEMAGIDAGRKESPILILEPPVWRDNEAQPP